MAHVNLTNPITHFEIVLMGNEPEHIDNFMGWIELRDGPRSAGFIYIEDGTFDSRLGGQTRPEGPYIVMSRRPADLGMLLALLSGGKPMQIRYSGEDSGNGTAFLESRDHAIDPTAPDRILATLK